MKRCKSCHYRRVLFGFPNDPACHYAIEEGRLRECEPEGCGHYRPKKRGWTKTAAGRAAEQILLG